MKKLNKLKNVSVLFVGLSLLIWSSCKTDKINPVVESTKDITGSWKIVKATRNGSDVLGIVDSNFINFNKFRITFNAGKYTLLNPLPFIVSQGGTYALDNPQYPFQITFTQTGATTPTSTAFTYPIVDGQRVLTLVFSPGCANNIYSYSLVKVN